MSDEQTKLIDEHLDFVEMYFCYSTKHFESINARLRGNERPGRRLDCGIKLIVDGVPQARQLSFKLTSDIGLERQCHLVVALRGIELDTGRKQIADEELVAAIQTHIGTRCVTMFKDLKWALAKDPSNPRAIDIAAWRESIDARSRDSIVRRFFEALKQPSPLRVDPEDGCENEVIALFSALIACGTLRPYQVHAISGSRRYDALIQATAERLDSVEPQYQRLCAADDLIASGSPSILVTEFKTSFSDLIDDFRNQIKLPNEVDLAVCWNVPRMTLPRGRIQPTFGERKDYRKYFGQTHEWVDGESTETVAVLSLRHMLLDLAQSVDPSSFGSEYQVLLDRDREDTPIRAD